MKRCEACRREFEARNTEEDAAREFRQNFGFECPPEERVIVCDDCYVLVLHRIETELAPLADGRVQ